jgi:hypothetical protein
MALLMRTVIALVAATLPAVAGADSAPLRATAGVDRHVVAVGDTFRLRINLEWADTIDVKPPAIGDMIGDFAVRDASMGPVTKVGGTSDQAISLLLTVFETGEKSIPPVPFFYVDAQGRLGKVETEVLSMEVESVLPDDAADIKDIKAPLAVPRRWKDLVLSYLLLVGLLAGTAASVMVSIKRREEVEALLARIWRKLTGPLRRLLIRLLRMLGLRRVHFPAGFDIEVKEPDLVAEEAAMKELARIEALELLSQGLVKDHYTLVSETVRRYLERRFGILAMESPTSYTMGAMSRLDVGAEAIGIIGEVLEETDLVKFAKHTPADEAAARLVDRARSVVTLAGRPAAVTAGEELSP